MESEGHSCIIQNIDFIPQTKKLRVWVAELSSKTQSWWTVAVRSRVPLYSLQTPGLAFSCCSLTPGGSEAIIFRSWLELSELWDNVKDIWQRICLRFQQPLVLFGCGDLVLVVCIYIQIQVLCPQHGTEWDLDYALVTCCWDVHREAHLRCSTQCLMHVCYANMWPRTRGSLWCFLNLTLVSL